MMLGRILATVLGLFMEVGLPNFKSRPYDEALREGAVML
jgi:hypothetical protein